LQLARALNRYSNMNAVEGYVFALSELPLTVARLVVDILFATVTKMTARRIVARWQSYLDDPRLAPG
jgi:hypothetical protein